MSLRQTIPLQKCKILKKSIRGMIGLGLLVGFLSVPVAAFLFGDGEGMPESMMFLRSVLRFVLPGLLLLLFCWLPIYEYLYWKRYFYDIDERNIVIRKGVLAQKEITLPFSRITDVYVDQDLIDVMFGLYDFHISTPTEESGRFAHIDGVNREGSQKLRQMILDRINRGES